MRGRPHSARAALIATGCLLLVVALVVPATAAADLLSPEAGPSENAVKTDTLYKIVFYIGITVIALVWAALFYSLFRYRARPGRAASRLMPRQISGNLALELGWTIAASAIVVAITIITYIFLPDIKNPAASGPASVAEARGQQAALNQPAAPGEEIEIQVSGQQYLWRYQYPNGTFSFQEMVVPRDQTVVLKVKANDVVHSWWIPELGGKVDAVPGYTNETWFKATENGVFDGQCAEFCGTNHPAMTAKVRVIDPEDYEQWLDRQEQLIAQGQDLAQEQRRQLEAQTTR